MKAILIDDEQDALDALENIISLNRHEVGVVATTTNPFEGLGLILQHKPDVVFLDIEMPGMSGFELLESLPEIHFEIVFATAYDHYAIKAIKNNALDYILKPVSISEVNAALEKVKEKRNRKLVHSESYMKLLKDIRSYKDERMKISTLNGYEFIQLDHLICLEADGAYTLAHLQNKQKLVITKTIKEVEKLLDTRLFFRTHRSYLVNLRHIKRYDTEKNLIMMPDDHEIPLARRRRDEFREMLDKLY